MLFFNIFSEQTEELMLFSLFVFLIQMVDIDIHSKKRGSRRRGLSQSVPRVMNSGFPKDAKSLFAVMCGATL